MCSAVRVRAQRLHIFPLLTNTILLWSVTLFVQIIGRILRAPPGLLEMQGLAAAMNSARVSGFTVSVATT